MTTKKKKKTTHKRTGHHTTLCGVVLSDRNFATEDGYYATAFWRDACLTSEVPCSTCTSMYELTLLAELNI